MGTIADLIARLADASHFRRPLSLCDTNLYRNIGRAKAKITVILPWINKVMSDKFVSSSVHGIKFERFCIA